LKANAGAAAIYVPMDGLNPKEAIATGKSKVEEQRPLLRNGDLFFDDVSHTYLSLEQILVAYLAAVEPVISKFKELIGC